MERVIALFTKEKIPFRQNAPMCDYTSFRVGGPADLLVLPKTKQQVIACQKYLSLYEIPYIVIGAGSNLVVADKGLSGAVILLGAPFNRTTITENAIVAEAGISLAKLSAIAQKAGLSGLEFASGIPGTLGGAVIMNAGAYGGEMKDVIVETEYIDKEGTVVTLKGEDCAFAYRTSIFSHSPSLILGATLQLVPKDPAEIKAEMHELNARRREKQPLNFPSAGSFFKRPTGYYAGKLIEDAGLKGFSVGGAQISEKHAGFVINTGGATAKDICTLRDYAQKTVFENFGVKLETEVRFLGDFSE